MYQIPYLPGCVTITEMKDALKAGVDISKELKRKLSEWAIKYGEWIDWDLDQIIENGIALEEEGNRHGAYLTEIAKQELSDI